MKNLTRRPRLGLVLAALTLALLLPAAARAQPFDAWLVLSGPTHHGYIEIPASSALNPTSGFTFEAWVAISNSPPSQDCRSIAGKNYLQAWWIGLCTTGGKPTLRSYLRGGGGSRDAGTIPPSQWTHVAVTWDGANRNHYINGELVASFAEASPPTTSGSPMRIGSDVSWEHTPTGAIDEVRLWNIARTTQQIRDALNERATGGESGLVGLWRLDANGNDAAGGHNGTLGGSGAGFLNFPAGPTTCTTTSTTLCLLNHFAVTVSWRDTGGLYHNGLVVPGVGTNASGLIYFFDPDNWELLIKMVNACGVLNNRFWFFDSGSTEQFYRLNVFDYAGFENKIYFSYGGTNAPAITDTGAFATCP